MSLQLRSNHRTRCSNHGETIGETTEPGIAEKERKVYRMKLLGVAVLVGLMTTLGASTAFGASSGSEAPSVDPEIQQYNKGVQLLMNKKFEKAEKRFRRALAEREAFAEAHNNLAYVLRKQGPEHYAEALGHYNRAIELNPDLPEPYMYRGVLHVQMENMTLAKKDHETLRSLSPKLSDELAYVIEHKREKEPEQFFGVSRETK